VLGAGDGVLGVSALGASTIDPPDGGDGENTPGDRTIEPEGVETEGANTGVPPFVVDGLLLLTITNTTNVSSVCESEAGAIMFWVVGIPGASAG
jgi:hypothetical protein